MTTCAPAESSLPGAVFQQDRRYLHDTPGGRPVQPSLPKELFESDPREQLVTEADRSLVHCADEAVDEPMDDETRKHLMAVSVYGERSYEGRYLTYPKGASRLSTGIRHQPPQVCIDHGGALAALQCKAPLPLSTATSIHQTPMLSAREQLLRYRFDDTTDSGRPAPRGIGVESGDHPLWENTSEGKPLDFVEIKTKWEGLNALEVSLVLVGDGPRGSSCNGKRTCDEYIGAVTSTRRWFLGPSRYACVVHATSSASSIDGETTMTVHLSEVPSAVKSLFVVASNRFHKTTLVHVLVSSRPSPTSPHAERRPEYLLDATPIAANSSAATIVLARLVRADFNDTSAGWLFGGLSLKHAAHSLEEVLPLLHTDAWNTAMYGPRPRLEKVTTPISPGVSLDEAIRAFPEADPAVVRLIWKTFNGHAGPASGSVRTADVCAVLEDLCWNAGVSASPGEVLKQSVDGALQKEYALKPRTLSFREFARVMKRLALYGDVCQARCRFPSK
ncbi:hypothetical protein DIPPA_11643 [Diplonema papillatum]|nr:hypothetical protein DIPPA_11643 [Diplonema papillatum]